MSNTTGFTRHLEAGEFIGGAFPVVVVDPHSTRGANTFEISTAPLKEADDEEKSRRRKLIESLEELDLPPQEKTTLWKFLADYHQAFSLKEGERGETDLIQTEIDTGDAYPKKQPARPMPFTLRQEVACQLDQMQKDRVL